MYFICLQGKQKYKIQKRVFTVLMLNSLNARHRKTHSASFIWNDFALNYVP